MQHPPRIVFFAPILLALACGGDDSVPNGDEGILPPDATFIVSGTVYDLETDAPMESAVTVTVDGLQSTPTVAVTGADFTIEVPANSAFHLLAGSFPNYRPTYNASIEVGAEDVSGVRLYVVREAFIDALTGDFGITPADGTGMMMLRVLGDDGQPAAGVPADAFVVPEGVLGPFFLTEELAASIGGTETSASGLVLFYDLAPGLISLEPNPASTYALATPIAPVDDSIISYVEASASGEPIVIPTNISFSNDVAPIFLRRGCAACHLGGGIGKDLGGLHLNGEPNKMHRELTEEISPNHGTTRVNLEDPPASLLLTMPSFEDPPDIHPFATFTGQNDPDYLTILVWIQEGALNN